MGYVIVDGVVYFWDDVYGFDVLKIDFVFELDVIDVLVIVLIKFKC